MVPLTIKLALVSSACKGVFQPSVGAWVLGHMLRVFGCVGVCMGGQVRACVCAQVRVCIGALEHGCMRMC